MQAIDIFPDQWLFLWKSPVGGKVQRTYMGMAIGQEKNV